MTPRRLLVVQSIGPLRVVMGHTLDALRSRNSASLGPGASMRSAKRLDAGSCALKKQPNDPGCLGWSRRRRPSDVDGLGREVLMFNPTPIERPRRPVAPGAAGTWRGFRQPLVFRQKAPPSSISFSPVAPFDFAFTSSLQVDVFSTQTNAVYRTLTRFKDVVRCASYRHDGKLLAAGDEGGCTQLFDLGSRTVMRTFTGHSRAVHVAKFMGDGGRLLTASDDGRALCWDVASEAQVCALEGHTDHIRSGALDPASPHVFATGSYDHTVKLWDVNAPRCVMTLRHVAPVEDVFILPGGGMVATASGNTLTVWDLLSGGRVLYAVSAHSKTITSLCADASAAHLLTASLDRSVKVYEMRTCKLVGAIKYDAPLTCCALSPLGTHLVVGTTDMSLCVRRRRAAIADAKAAAAAAPQAERDPLDLTSYGAPGYVADGRGAPAAGPRHGTYRYFLRGRRHAAQPGDVVISSSLPAKLAGWDAALRRFRYHEAFDAALADGSPEVVVSVVEELVQRHGLRIALQGRDQQTLQPVVAFLARQICHPPFAPTLIGVANLLLDMYAPVLGQSAAIDELFVKLRNTLEAEMKLQAELAQLLGSMDVLLAGSVHASSSLPPPRKVPRLAIAATSSTDSGATATAHDE